MFSEVASVPILDRPSHLSAEVPPPTPPPAPPQPQGPNRRPLPGVPWFWISGVLMFLGCFLLNAAAHQRKDELLPVLGLVFVFNLYELAVLSLAAWLRRNGAEGESRWLAWLAVILLADSTFVYHTLSVADPVIGGAVAGLGITLAAIKLAIVLHVADIRLKNHELVAAGVSLATVFLLPVAARIVGPSGFLGIGFVHLASWWVAACLAIGLWAWDRASSYLPKSTPGGALRLAVLGLPIVSMSAHVAELLWMYRVPELGVAELSPILLGLCLVLVVRSKPIPWRLQQPVGRRALAMTCGIAAVLTAEASELEALVHGWPNYLAVTPVRVVLMIGALGLAAAWSRQRSTGLLLAWPSMVLIALLGPTLEAAIEEVASALKSAGPTLNWLVPRTLAQWGAIAVFAAFVLLAAGGWSARRRVTPAGSRPPS